MTFPSTSFSQNDSGGTARTLAADVKDGIEYPVVMVAQQSGHIAGSLDTWTVLADAVALSATAGKNLLSIFNGTGSGAILRIRKLFLVDLQLSSVSGVAIRIDVKKTSAQSSGTAITPFAHDSQNVALPSQCLFATGATATASQTWFPITIATDEVGVTQAFPSNLIMQATNWLPEGAEVEELVLREGNGVTVVQTTATSVGSLGLICVMTRE